MKIRYTLVLLMAVFAISCKEAKQIDQPVKKKIQVSYHKGIETVMILRSLSDTDYFISRIHDTDKSRPLLYKARQYFAAYRSHPAVAETQRILYSASDIGSLLFQGVIYGDTLPKGVVSLAPNDAYWKERKDTLSAYLRLLADFYQTANVEQFFRDNATFYDGAIAEARQYINDSIVNDMEEYFGKANASYHMYVVPMCPYAWGFALTTQDSAGKSFHAVISPVISSDGESGEFGFGGPEAAAHYRELVVHEFVHPFINISLFKAELKKYDTLFTPSLDSSMQEQGYNGWMSFVDELFVRTGHIRVAEKFSKAEADALRKVDMDEYKFVLVPEIEEKMKEYESNRDKYKNIDGFLPDLISTFAKVNRNTINERISKPADK